MPFVKKKGTCNSSVILYPSKNKKGEKKNRYKCYVSVAYDTKLNG